MRTLNLIGKPCPIPVIEAKKALSEQETTRLLLKVDNEIAVQNLKKMADGYNYGFSFNTPAPDCYEVMILKNGEAAVTTDEPLTSSSGAPTAEPTVVVGSRSMGNGAEELGQLLIKGFLYSLTELSVAPKHVIFFNSGVHLTAEGANTTEDLQKLADKGTEILSCGTCVNYYGLQDKLAVGKIVNMYEITQRLAASGTVINI